MLIYYFKCVFWQIHSGHRQGCVLYGKILLPCGKYPYLYIEMETTRNISEGKWTFCMFQYFINNRNFEQKWFFHYKAEKFYRHFVSKNFTKCIYLGGNWSSLLKVFICYWTDHRHRREKISIMPGWHLRGHRKNNISIYDSAWFARYIWYFIDVLYYVYNYIYVVFPISHRYSDDINNNLYIYNLLLLITLWRYNINRIINIKCLWIHRLSY